MRRPRLRSLFVATTAVAYVLVLLGIYTAAAGAGLTCAGRWPLCDGAVFGLFPANWPSFVEWFHRLVAMVAGFMILGAAYGAWRALDDSRVKGAMVVAVLLLPVQIWLGAQTVLTYTFVSLTGHFVTAIVIFAALTLSTLRLFGRDLATVGRVRHALVAVVVLYPILVVLSPGGSFTHTVGVQVLYYAIGIAVFAAFVASVVWTGLLRSDAPRLARVRVLTAAGAVLAGVQLLLGRFVYTDLIQLLDAASMLAVFVLALIAVRSTYRIDPTATARGRTS